MLRGGLVALALLSLGAVALAGQAPTTPAKAPEKRFVLAAVGDILFDRGVREAMKDGGADGLFDGVAARLRQADIAVCNLECPLSTRGLRSAKPFSFRADPAHAAALARAGFDVALLANNHTLDYGRGALLDTVAAVEAAGVVGVGAGRTRAEATAARVVEAGGMRVAFVGFCDLFVEGTTPRSDVPGISTGDREAVLAEIRRVRPSVDAVVLLLHWGVEYSPRPTDSQRAFAREAVEAGAALVLGSHPHVLQPVEREGAGLVAYSLGNFVFDQRRPDSADSAILLVTLTPAGVERYEAQAVRIESCRPRLATPEESPGILRRMKMN